ncbi:MAG TPA: HXXEE domain-containing protein [Capillimicrobium sp.]|jgi:hypothetical protein
MTVDTHGRWPWGSAALVAPTWAAAIARRGELAEDGRWVAWLALPILVAHQTEEWVRPGGFLPFVNQRLLGSGEPAWPLTERLGLVVNVPLGWGSAVAGALLWRRSPALAAGVLAMEAGNALMHGSMAVRERCYNPGSVTGPLLMGAHAAAGAAWLARSGRMSRRSSAGAVAIGAAFAALPLAMKARLHRGR